MTIWPQPCTPVPALTAAHKGITRRSPSLCSHHRRCPDRVGARRRTMGLPEYQRASTTSRRRSQTGIGNAAAQDPLMAFFDVRAKPGRATSRQPCWVARCAAAVAGHEILSRRRRACREALPPWCRSSVRQARRTLAGYSKGTRITAIISTHSTTIHHPRSCSAGAIAHADPSWPGSRIAARHADGIRFSYRTIALKQLARSRGS